MTAAKSGWSDLVIETEAMAKAIADIGKHRENLFDDFKETAVDCPSTGGSGNKLPVIVPPIVIATLKEHNLEGKVVIPKMSTRGIPGGTIDILESVGYDAEISLKRYTEIVKRIGYSNIKPTVELAPVDEMLMNLRREMGMIRHPQLVVASILGKKLATNCYKLVIEVKNGLESKMRFPSVSADTGAKFGAQLFLEVGKKLGMEIVCLVTNGNRPQGKFIGNKLAMIEVVAILQGETKIEIDGKEISIGESLKQLATKTAFEMLRFTNEDLDEAKIEKVFTKQDTGFSPAFDCFKQQMKEHGADIEDFAKDIKKKTKEILTKTEAIEVDFIKSPAEKHVVTDINVTAIDDCAKLLIEKNGKITDYDAGIILHKQVGDEVKNGDILAMICNGNLQNHPQAMEILRSAFVIEKSNRKIESSDLISIMKMTDV